MNLGPSDAIWPAMICTAGVIIIAVTGVACERMARRKAARRRKPEGKS